MNNFVLMAAFLSACNSGDKDTSEGSTGNSLFDDSDTDGNPESGCPSDVPEEYKYLWDCENAEGCSAKLYRYGVGSSEPNGDITVTEKWFSFTGPGNYCVDTFEIAGTWSPLEPEARGCTTCEGIYNVTWTMVDAQCGVLWSPFFADQAAETAEGQVYDGFVLFDTHGEFGDLRNEDNNMLVIGTPVNGNSYAPNGNWARGSATPTDPNAVESAYQDDNGDWCCTDPLAGEQQPEEYVWANAGDCLQ